MSVSESEHKALRLPRNLLFKVRKALCLPRTLHIEAPQVLCLPGSPSGVLQQNLRVTKSALHEVCTSRLTKSTRSAAPSQSASTITTISKVLHLPRILHFKLKPFRPRDPVTRSRLWTTKTRGFPRTCHEKRPPCTKMRTAPQRERSRDKHTLQPPRFREPAKSKCSSGISRGMSAVQIAAN